MANDDEDEKPDWDNELDALFRMRSDFDQMIAAIPDFARLAMRFYDGFKEAGFNEQQAMYLTAVELVRDPGDAPS